MRRKRKALIVFVSGETVRIVDGWESALDAQRLFLALCRAALEKRVKLMKLVPIKKGADPESRLPFEMHMQTDDHANFTSEFVTITERCLPGGWGGIGHEWEIKGKDARDVLKTAARMLGMEIKIL